MVAATVVRFSYAHGVVGEVYIAVVAWDGKLGVFGLKHVDWETYRRVRND